MAYADELVRVQVRYTPFLETTWAGELALITFHLRHHHITGNGFTWADQVHHLPEQLHGKWVDHWATNIGDAHPTSVHIDQFKVSHIDAAGHVLEEGAFDVTDNSLRGLGSDFMLPPEVALCVSAYSYEPGSFAANKGRKRGRFYLPYIGTGHNSQQGRVSAAWGAQLALDYQALFNDVQGMHTFNEDTPPDPTPDFWDFVTVSKVDATWHNVDWLAIDDKFDSQRRRQHQAGATRWINSISH